MKRDKKSKQDPATNAILLTAITELIIAIITLIKTLIE